MQILKKVWEHNIVYQEPICFSEDINGIPSGGTLLFSPSKIISIVSYDGKIKYQENIDYIVVGKKIVRTAQSQIPFFPRSMYCKPYVGENETNWVRLPSGTEYMDVVSDVYRWQVLVTYEHDLRWDGLIPPNRAAQLPLFFDLIKHSNRPIRTVFFGDSITAGWEASGCNEHAIDMITLDEYHVLIQHPPFQPSWAELISKSLIMKYPNTDFVKINRAAGGCFLLTKAYHTRYCDLPNPEDSSHTCSQLGYRKTGSDPTLRRTVPRKRAADLEKSVLYGEGNVEKKLKVRWGIMCNMISHRTFLFIWKQLPGSQFYSTTPRACTKHLWCNQQLLFRSSVGETPMTFR